MPETKKKAPPKRKVEYVNDILALSEGKEGVTWNRKNLEDKTTIPNLKNIIALLKA